jgi:hypothetical protein
LPKNVSTRDAEAFYKAVKKGMKLWSHLKHI